MRRSLITLAASVLCATPSFSEPSPCPSLTETTDVIVVTANQATGKLEPTVIGSAERVFNFANNQVCDTFRVNAEKAISIAPSNKCYDMDTGVSSPSDVTVASLLNGHKVPLNVMFPLLQQYYKQKLVENCTPA